jgi:hypothetical protein
MWRTLSGNNQDQDQITSVMITHIKRNSPLYRVTKEGNMICIITIPDYNELMQIDNNSKVTTLWVNGKYQLEDIFAYILLEKECALSMWDVDANCQYVIQKVILVDCFINRTRYFFSPLTSLNTSVLKVSS